MPLIHITVDLEATIRQKLRAVTAPPYGARIMSDRLYQSGYRAALEWILQEAGLDITRYHAAQSPPPQPTRPLEGTDYDRHD